MRGAFRRSGAARAHHPKVQNPLAINMVIACTAKRGRPSGVKDEHTCRIGDACPFLAPRGTPWHPMHRETRRNPLGKARMPFGSRAQCARITRLIRRRNIRVCFVTRTRIPRRFARRGFPADRPASCALSHDNPGPARHPQALAGRPCHRLAPDGACRPIAGRPEAGRSVPRDDVRESAPALRWPEAGPEGGRKVALGSIAHML